MAQGSPQDGRNTLADIDITRPNVARVYDYFVGGKDNFTADRDYANKVLEVAPKAAQSVLQNREFLRRVVRHMAEAGIDQFLDLGSGLPTQGNVSEVAQEVNPSAHVVYVDNDPMVYIHSRALLTDKITVDIVSADVRDPAAVLAAPAVESLLDFDRPIGLLMLAVLHHLEDADEPGSIVARFRGAMPRGSYLAISSFRMPGPELPELRALTIENEKVVAKGLGSGRWREDAELRTWFGDWELLEPGFVALQEWRPAPGDYVKQDAVFQSVYGGVARKK
jgi:S-adenosyl methyltransferase